MDHYKGVVREGKKERSRLYEVWGVKKHLLNDLYIRFFRLAEHRIGEKAEYGVVSFISNSSYLTGRSHPIMRESLLANFHTAWIDALNGDKYRILAKVLLERRFVSKTLFRDIMAIRLGSRWARPSPHS